MEQQTVTIAKAGIHASLNARSSVVAAANPIYGQYDKTRRPQENIGLPDSLLSRFDLLFIVLDQLDSTLDRTLSEHVIKSHQYRRPGTLMEPEALNMATSLNLDDTQDASVAVDTAVWQRGGRVFTDSTGSSSGTSNNNNSSSNGELLTKEFLRKYIHYAKNRVQPVLSEEAMQAISGCYANMRARQTRKNLPVTARTLETMIRLSSAAAKSRLSNSVDEHDVDVAMELLNFVMFHEIGRDDNLDGGTFADVNNENIASSALNRRRPGATATTATAASSSSSSAEVETQPQFSASAPSVTGAATGTAAMGEQEELSEEDLDDSQDLLYAGDVDSVDETSPRFLAVRSMLDVLFTEEGRDAVPVTEVLQRLNSTTSSSSRRFNRREVVAALTKLEQQNKVRPSSLLSSLFIDNVIMSSIFMIVIVFCFVAP